MTNIEKLNDAWLAAWTSQDADRLAALYTDDCHFFDTQLPDGSRGRTALRERFAKLFELAPPMTYEPDRVWAIEGGFCSRWICTISGGGAADIQQMIRGFGLVLLRDGLIAHNEIYTHPIQTDFRG